MRHDSCICAMNHLYVPWLIHVCHDSSTCAMTHPRVHTSSICAMSHVTELWVMSRSHESCHGVMSHVTESCHGVTSHVTESWVMSLNYKSCHGVMSHVTELRVMSRSHESCHGVMSHVTALWVMSRSHAWCDWRQKALEDESMTQWLEWLDSRHISMGHGTYEWVMAHRTESCNSEIQQVLEEESILTRDSPTCAMTRPYVPWRIHVCHDSLV